MIIPRHKVCDICGYPVGINKRYYIIKSKNFVIYNDVYSDNRTHHICEDCLYEFIIYLQTKLKESKEK